MKRTKVTLATVLAEADARMRRASALPPRLVRREAAASYVTAPQLFAHMEKAGWIYPTVQKHAMTLFDLNDVDACIERLKAGEYPGEIPQPEEMAASPTEH